MNKYALITVVLVLISLSSKAQKEDFNWLIGDRISSKLSDSIHGWTSFDFNYDPVRMYVETERKINIAGGNASISTSDGRPIAFTNGQQIIDGSGRFIEDTINYEWDLPFHCRDWEYNNDREQSLPLGLLGSQRIIFLPVGDEYYVVYDVFDRCKFAIYKLSYSKFRFTENLPIKLDYRDVTILREDSLGSSGVYAIRHGNGRDWWVVTLSSGFEWVYVFEVNPDGVHYRHKLRTGYVKRANGTGGQICFSHDGKYLVFYTGNTLFSGTGGGFCVTEFDRCTGTIQGLKCRILPHEFVANGVEFSHDSRYLYVANGTHLRQYDLRADSLRAGERLVAIFDGFYYHYISNGNPDLGHKYPVNFHNLKLAPDGRIYIFPSSAEMRYLSYIENPHEHFLHVDVRQHSIYTPRNFTRTLPNNANFRLGPSDGSPCDTLGLDNHPVAKFRYAADTLDHLRIRFTDLSYYRPESWSWDFGDGSPKVSDRYPFHRYAQNGTYNVCLTVSNENSSHTTCRTITIGTSSSDDVQEPSSVADITLYPNPVVDDLLLTLGEYIPEYGVLHLYDMTGRQVHSQRIWYGQNSVVMSRLHAGMYLLRIFDGSMIIKERKVVKI